MNELFEEILFKREIDRMLEKYFTKPEVSFAEILAKLEELDDEIEHLKEELEDLEQDLQDNYKPIPPAEQYGIDERDFI